MTELKREYVIPLRRKTLKAPKWRRSKKAVSVLKEFVQKHMKTDNVIICNELNEAIWGQGIKNPPGKVEVIALKSEFNGEEKCIVNLLSVGLEAQLKIYNITEAKKTETKKEVKEAKVKKTEETKVEETKVETAKETKTEEVKANE